MVLSYDYKDVEQEHGLAYGLGQKVNDKFAE